MESAAQGTWFRPSMAQDSKVVLSLSSLNDGSSLDPDDTNSTIERLTLKEPKRSRFTTPVPVVYLEWTPIKFQFVGNDHLDSLD